MTNREINADELGERASELSVGEHILLSGTIYTARDAAHKRIKEIIGENGELPFPIKGAVIYYAGPTAAPPNLPIGSCGPTTSSRMDAFSPQLLDLGLACMIGKGERSREVIDAIIRNRAVYLCAVGGAGALACKAIRSSEVIGFPELGCESVKRLTVERFPLIVAVDCRGGNIFKR